MKENDSAFPSYPGIIRERAVIQRACFMYLTCKPCEVLGWKKDCPGKENCGVYLYGKLQRHFSEVANAKRSTAKPF